MDVLASMMQQRARDIMVACGLLIGALIVLGVFVWYYRRRWLVGVDTSPLPWTFEDLRRLRDQGELSEEEYQRLRAAMIGAATGEPRESPPRATPTESDASGDTVWAFDMKKTPPG